MSILYTTETAFQKAKKYLEENQFFYTVKQVNNGYLVEVTK